MLGPSKLREASKLYLQIGTEGGRGDIGQAPTKPAPQEGLSTTIVTELPRKEEAKRSCSLTTRLVSRGAKGPALMNH